MRLLAVCVAASAAAAAAAAVGAGAPSVASDQPWRSSSAVLPKEVGRVAVPEPAFTAIVDGDLWISSFTGNPLRDGSLWVARSLRSQLSAAGGNWSAVKVEAAVPASRDVFLWPNELVGVPQPLSDGGSRGGGVGVGVEEKSSRRPTTRLGRGLLVADGFLPPGKGDGAVYFVNTSSPSYAVTKLSPPAADGGEWFYHRCEWVDVNGDGLADVLTARAHKPLIGDAKAQLVVFLHPAAAKPMTFPWTEQVLADGPDVSFLVTEAPGSARQGAKTGTAGVALDGGVPVYSAPVRVYATEFFGQRLVAFDIAEGGKVTSQQTLASDLGELYDVKLLPDGNSAAPPALLVTNYHYSCCGGLYLFRATSAAATSFTRETINDSFKNVQWAVGSGAPGFIQPHFPSANTNSTSAGELPNIALCGDGSEAFYMLTPTTTSKSSVDKAAAVARAGPEFELARTVNYDATVGSVFAGQLDPTRPTATQILVGIYEKGFLAVYSY